MKSSKKAFTLLELFLVITIISVILGVTIPLINRSIKNTSFKSFVNKVYLSLDYTKTQCILKNIVLKVDFDSENNKIFIKENSDQDSLLSEIEIPQNINLDIDKETIIFYPDGTLEEFKVIISDGSQRQSIISSSGFDGKIKVDDGKES